MEENTAKEAPKEPPKSKAIPDSEGQAENEGLNIKLVATVRQGRAQQSTHERRDYTPPPLPQKRSPWTHDPGIKLSGKWYDPFGKKQFSFSPLTTGIEPSPNSLTQLNADETFENKLSKDTQAHDKAFLKKTIRTSTH